VFSQVDKLIDAYQTADGGDCSLPISTGFPLLNSCASWAAGFNQATLAGLHASQEEKVA